MNEQMEQVVKQDAMNLQNDVARIMEQHKPATPEAVVEPVAEQPVAEAPVVETPEAPKAEEAKSEVQEELLEFVEEETPAQTNVEIPEWVKDLGIEASTPEEIKAKWNEINENLVKYKVQAEDKYANDKVRQLNDYVKQGGDLDAYLSRKEQVRAFDQQIEAVKSIDPIEAVKWSLKQQDLSDEDIQAYIDTEPEIKLKVEGKRLIQAEIQALTGEKSKLEQQEAADLEMLTKRREQYQAKVNEALGNVKQIHGVKVSDKDLASLKEIAKDPHQVLRKYFPVDEQGNIKADVLAKNIALLELGDKYADFVRKVAKGEGQKGLFNKIGVVPKSENGVVNTTDVKTDETPKVDVAAFEKIYREAMSKV